MVKQTSGLGSRLSLAAGKLKRFQVRGASGHVIEQLEQRQLLTAYYDNGSLIVLGNGTAASPWDSLYAISSYTGFQPGDIVYLSGTFKNQNLFLNSPARGITLTSLNSASPATISEDSSYTFINAIDVNTSGVTLSYLNMTGPGINASSGTYYAIDFENDGTTSLNGATVDHINESGFVYGGLDLGGDSAGFANAVVSNSNFSNNQVSGIVVEGPDNAKVNTNLLITHCTTSYNAGYAVYFNTVQGLNENAGNGGIYLGSVSTGTVTSCTSIGNCYKSNAACGIWAHNCTNLIFQYSEAADNATITSGLDGNGFDFDDNVTNSLMQYDYSHGNNGVGLYICTALGTINNSNDTIRYCVSDDDGTKNNYGMRIYSGSSYFITNANFYNNTVIIDGSKCAAAIGINGPGAASCTANFLNNIVYITASGTTTELALDCSSFTPSANNLKFEGNDYYCLGSAASKFKIKWGSTTYTALDGTGAWATNVGEEKNGATYLGYNIDPGLISETVSDLPIASVGNLAVSATSALRFGGLSLTVSPFTAAPYSNGAPYNVAGTAWGGLGSQDYFGNPIAGGVSTNMGAGQTSVLTIGGVAGGDTITLKEDATTAHALDVNSTVYKGIWSVVFNGSTGTESITYDYINGPLTDSAGVVSTLGVYFTGGTGNNSLTEVNSGAGAVGSMPITYVPAGVSSLNVAVGAVTVPAGNQTGIRVSTFSNIVIGAGAKVTFASALANQSNRTLAVVTGNVTLAGGTNAWTGTLDLGGNDLDARGGNISVLMNQVAQQFNSSWQGSGGITSSLAAFDMTRLSGVGVIQNTVDGTPSGAILKTTFDTYTAAATDILIKYTYIGDDQLSGAVDATDYSRIDNGFLTGSTGWFNGDFNYDGVVNGSDYTLIDNAFNRQGASLAAQVTKRINVTHVSSRIIDQGSLFSQSEWVDSAFWLRKHAMVEPTLTSAMQVIENPS